MLCVCVCSCVCGTHLKLKRLACHANFSHALSSFFVLLRAKKETSNEKWLNRKVWWNKIWIMNEYVHERRVCSRQLAFHTISTQFCSGKLFRVTCIFRHSHGARASARQPAKNTWNKMRNCLFIPWSRAFEGTRSRGKFAATRWMRDRRGRIEFLCLSSFASPVEDRTGKAPLIYVHNLNV